MGTKYRQGDSFLRAVISATLLEDAIAWIRSNMYPEEVFSDEDLRIWASEVGLTKEED